MNAKGSFFARSHYQNLYSRHQHPYEAALDALLPDSLKHPEVFKLKSTAFLPIEALNRLQNRIIKQIHKIDQEKHFILADLGCGRGYISQSFSSIPNVMVFGVDWSINSGNNAKNLICADICKLPIQNEVVEIAIAIDSLYMIDNVVSAFHECHRILTSSGSLLLTLYDRVSPIAPIRNKEWWNKIFHITGFKVEEWLDVTLEWRTMMRNKHEKRLRAEKMLVSKYGSVIIPELEVSRKMIGSPITLGFLDTCSRWEITLKR